MKDNNEPEKEPKSSCLKTLIIICVFLSCTFTVFYLTIWRIPDYSEMADTLRRELQESYDESINIPPDENAWTYYEKALNNLKEIKDIPAITSLKPSYLGEPFCEEKREDADLYLESNKETFDYINRAYKCEKFQFPYQYGAGLSGINIDFGKIRDMARLVILKGNMDRERNNYRMALENYFQVLFLGMGLGNKTPIVNGLAGIALQAMAMEELRSTLNNHTLSEEDLNYADRQFRRLESFRFNSADLFNYEFLCVSNTLDNMTKNPAANATPYLIFFNHYLLPREAKINEKIHFEIMDQLEKGGMKLTNLKAPDLPPLSVLCKSLLVDYNSTHKITLINRTYYEGLKILTAIMLFKSKNGKFPEKLEELAPDFMASIPADPYAGNGMFKYENKGNYFKLYSIGPDLKDNNGKIEGAYPYDYGDIVISGK